MSDLDLRSINTIRVLSADAIQKAKSGHPGLPLGCAAIGYELFKEHMNHNPKDPAWANRDRFILSGGHGSMLLYSLLHLYGYGNLSIEDLKQFRQFGSLTPGHPEYGHTVGVEATTGPLGAGMGMAVGMAIAQSHMAEVFNKDGYNIIDHYIYVLGGDGCMMEGISSEAFSLAGTLGLDRLIVFYDSNNISIEGSTDLAFTEDVAKRFEAFGFQVIEVADGNDLDLIDKAVAEAKADKERPSLIICKTKIGFGCPKKEGTASAHGEPLGDENLAELKTNLGFNPDEFFHVDEEVYDNFKDIVKKKEAVYDEWQKLFAEYCEKYPDMKKKWDEYHDTDRFKDIFDDEDFFSYEDKPEATRNVSGKLLNKLAAKYENILGGSADLAPSNKTKLSCSDDYSKNNRGGRNFHFGVREIAMTAIGNGMMLYGGLKAYVATFFVFSDYVKPMARLSAIMQIPLTFVFTHDSIGVGEDGPTHEPVEQLAMLRALPGFVVFRPADYTETAVAWAYAISSKNTPTALVLTRQNLPQLQGSSKEAVRGGYIVSECKKGTPDAIIIASGSEVALSIAAQEELLKEGIDVRVVSMPSMELFDMQDEAYKEKVLPKNIRARVAVEALSTFGWDRYVGLDGEIIGMTTFGASGPQSQLFEHFGFTVKNVCDSVKRTIR